MLTRLKHNPKLFQELGCMGYAEDQIPLWATRPGTRPPRVEQPKQPKQRVEQPKLPKPAEIPVPMEGISTTPASTVAQPSSGQPSSAPATQPLSSQVPGQQDPLVSFIAQNPDYEQWLRKPSYENKGTIIMVLFL